MDYGDILAMRDMEIFRYKNLSLQWSVIVTKRVLVSVSK